MSGILVRIGGLLILAGILYQVVREVFLRRGDNPLTVPLLEAGAASLAGGAVLWVAGKAGTRLLSAACPRCGRRVARGRVYCEDHLQETINTYRDQQHKRKG